MYSNSNNLSCQLERKGLHNASQTRHNDQVAENPRKNSFGHRSKNSEVEQNPTLYNPAKSPAKAAKKRAYDRMFAAVFKQAHCDGLIDQKPESTIDSTGLESSYVSRHFLMRCGKRTSRYRRWTKLTIVGHNSSHLIASSSVGIGPSSDNPDLAAVVTEAVEHLPIYRLIADSGYDSENNHWLCREKLGVAGCGGDDVSRMDS